MSLTLRPLVAAMLVANMSAAFPFCVYANDPTSEPATPDGGDAVVLPKVIVEYDRASIAPARRVEGDSTQAAQAATSDAASLLDRLPGVSINAAGGVSGLPSIRGLADDRLRIRVDGADIVASCPNHLNPALSYVAPSDIARITVYPGLEMVVTLLAGRYDDPGSAMELPRRLFREHVLPAVKSGIGTGCPGAAP